MLQQRGVKPEMQRIHHETRSFDGFTLDLTRGCLLRGAAEIKLRPKSFEVLKYLVENSGRLVAKTELIETVWADAFVTDNSLVQCLIEVRRALGDVEQQYIKTVPRRGYIFTAEVNDSEPAMPGAIYHGQLEGVKVVIEEGEETEDRVWIGPEARPVLLPATRFRWPATRRFWLTTSVLVSIVVALAIGALFLFRHRATPGEAKHAPINSIAVLQLRNLTNDPENEYFTDGMTESLITSLSKLDGLKVIARGSVFRFKGKDVDAREVGKQLGVAAVLEGSVRKEGDRMRVAVRLASAEDGRVLWASETDDHAPQDIFALQDEVARGVAASLRGKLSGEGERQLTRRYTDNVEAYQLYLKGRYFWNKRTEDALKKGIEYFEQAIQKDPNYALAYAGLADSYALLDLYTGLQRGDVFPKARAAAAKALEIDDALAEAHTSLSYVKYYYEWDWSGAEKELKRAIEINPNYATAHQWYAEYLFYMQRFDESLAEINRAYELDPLSLVINTELGSPYLYMRQYDQAMEKYRKALEMDPHFFLANYCLALCYGQKSMYREAISALGSGKDVSATVGYFYAASGRRKEAREMLDRIMEISKREYFSPYLIAKVHAGLGEKDEAFAWLEEAYQERDERMVMLRVDMHLDGLRSDPRFTDLLERVGLVPRSFR